MVQSDQKPSERRKGHKLFEVKRPEGFLGEKFNKFGKLCVYISLMLSFFTGSEKK